MNNSFYLGNKRIKDLFTKRRIKPKGQVKQPFDMSNLADTTKEFITKNIVKKNNENGTRAPSTLETIRM